MNRIAQDIFVGVMRQFDARGEDWLMTRGGLGRLDDSISKSLISGAKSKSLSIDKIEEILSDVDLESQKILLNTLGGRMPYGFRVAGTNIPVAPEAVALAGPVAPAAAPLVAPVAPEETPEVAAARAEHLAAVEKAKADASAADE